MKNNISNMGKIKAGDRRVVNDLNADVGIGVLIVFIAMIAVAAIAASVLMQTASTMSERTRMVVSDATKDVSNGIWVHEVYGLTNEQKSHIEYLGIVTKLSPGAQDMDLSEVRILVRGDELKILSFDNTSYGDVVANIRGSGSVFDSINKSNLSSQNFGIIALLDNDDSIANVFGMGTNDRAMLVVNLSAIFGDNIPREGISIELLPPVGQAVTHEITFPATMDKKVVDLSH